MAQPWRLVPGGVALTVRLTPKGGRDAIDGIATLADGSAVLKARVRAAPRENAANDALLALIAKTVAVPRRDVALTAGATARVKTLTILGNDATIIAALEKVLAR